MKDDGESNDVISTETGSHDAHDVSCIDAGMSSSIFSDAGSAEHTAASAGAAESGGMKSEFGEAMEPGDTPGQANEIKEQDQPGTTAVNNTTGLSGSIYAAEGVAETTTEHSESNDSVDADQPGDVHDGLSHTIYAEPGSTTATGNTERPASNAEMREASDPASIEGAPNSRITVDGTRYYTDDNGHAHMVYNRENHQWDLIPNNSYERNGYTYKTDDRGRISHVEASLELSSDERGAMNARVTDMRDGDDRGHIVAARYNGSNGIDNLAPQMSEVNRGEYKALENMLARERSAGHEVYAEYDLLYEDASGRPNAFVVSYRIDNGEYEMAVFNNIREE